MGRYSSRAGALALLVCLLGAAGCRSHPAQAAAVPSTLTYTPAGCSYSVSTPDVSEATPGTDEPATRPPDHVHASYAGDPASTFAVNWRSEPGARGTQLLYGTRREAVVAATGATEGVRLQHGHTLLYRSAQDAESTRLHEVHVCGLAPATTYFYKVGAPGAFSPVYAVTTAPTTGSTSAFRFGISGDARDSANIFATTQKGIHDAGAAFEIFTGDAVIAGNRQPLWDAFFEAGASGTSVQDVLASTPLMVANGNHEGLAVNYLAQFAVPQRAGASGSAHGEDWYAFDYGNAHFIALNDTTADLATFDQETVWLEENLRQVNRQRTPWLFVYHHRPPYSCGTNHGSDVNVRKRWQPLFDKYGVDVVFNGHEHQYERSKPIRGLAANGDGVVVDAGPVDQLKGGVGTVYIVSAGAGAGLYGVSQKCAHTQSIEKTFHYLVADVADRVLSVQAYRLDGTVLDRFTISK